MKKIYLLSIILLLSVIGFSQAYKPMLEENKTWDVEMIALNVWYPPNGDPCGYRYVINGDTTINSILYKKIYISSVLYGFPSPHMTIINELNEFAREDTLGKKIFSRYPSDTTETLIFDFNLNVGDTFTNCGQSFPQNKAIVDSLSTIVIADGSVRKIIHFSPINFYVGAGSLYFIEGIGSTQGFLSPFQDDFESNESLNCVKLNDTTLYSGGQGYWGLGSCIFNLTTAVKEINTDYSFFKIYPNPNNGEQVSIVGDNIKTIDILNLQGQLIKTIEASTNEVLINLENQAKGIYFVKARFKNGEIVIKKLLINL